MIHRLWLVRHAQSLANAGHPTNNAGCYGLTDLGREQSQRFAASISERPDRIVVSTYARAQETAIPLLSKFGMEAEPHQIHEWSFLSPANYQGTSQKERQTAAALFRATAGPDTSDGHGAESYLGLEGRVERFLAHEEGQKGFTIAFTHGRFMRAVVHVLNWKNAKAPKQDADTRFRCFWLLDDVLPVPNTQVFQLEWDGDKWLMDPFGRPYAG